MMSPDSLFNLCIEAGLQADPKDYKNLPPPIKSELLQKRTQYGSSSFESLQNLIHLGLQNLDLRKCFIPEGDLLIIARMKSLKILNLPEPPTVKSNAYSESALIHMIGNKSFLQELRVGYLEGVTDKVVRALVKHSLDLKVLHLGGTSISDESLFSIQNLQGLTDLNIERTKVTDEGIEEFSYGDAKKSLNFICIKECNLLTNSSLKILLGPKTQICLFSEDLSPGMSHQLLDSLARLKMACVYGTAQV